MTHRPLSCTLSCTHSLQLEGGSAALVVSQKSPEALQLPHLRSQMPQLLSRAAAISWKQVSPALLTRAHCICANVLLFPHSGQRPFPQTKRGWVGDSHRRGDRRPKPSRATKGPAASSMEGRAIPCPHPNSRRSKSIGFLYQPKR